MFEHEDSQNYCLGEASLANVCTCVNGHCIAFAHLYAALHYQLRNSVTRKERDSIGWKCTSSLAALSPGSREA